MRLGEARLSPTVVLWTAAGAFAAGFGSLAALRHLAFNTGRFDLGNMVQAVWATAHGEVLSVTDLHGDQISRLGAHFDPILAAFAPLWWLWPDPTMLLVVQALAIAVGAWPVFLLARKHLGSERAGVGFGLAYLLYPPTQWLALNEFHAVALATPLLLFGFWYLDEDRLVAFAVVAGLACLTKEHVPLAVAALGVWYALARGRRRAGAVIAAAGVAVSAVAIGVVVPHFAPAGSSPVRGPLPRGGRLAARDRRNRFHRSPACPRAGVRRSRSPVPAGAAAAAARAPAPGTARRADGASGARRQPALLHADPDVDPLPLHRGRDSRPHGRRRSRGGQAAHSHRPRAHARHGGRRRRNRRQLRARRDPRLARLSRR